MMEKVTFGMNENLSNILLCLGIISNLSDLLKNLVFLESSDVKFFNFKFF